MTTEYDAFASIYDVQSGKFDADLDFYVGLAREAQPPVLELATGTGRVSLPIARAGVPIVGVDSSVEMLAVARAKLAKEPDLPLSLVQADMRDFDLPDKGAFGLALVPYRSFLHLTTVEDQIACLRRIHEHLRPGGSLALNFFMPDLETIAAYQGKLGRVVSCRYSFSSPASGNEIEVWEYRQYHVHQQFIDQRFVYHEWDADGTLLRTTRRGFTLCYIWPREFEHLLARCGFEVEALYGWFDRRPFEDGSAEQVWVARKQNTD
jgi:ubiquinone/menaquinone biosynthesis C-methylase UbiE